MSSFRPRDFKTIPATGYEDFMQMQQDFIEMDSTNVAEKENSLLKNSMLKSKQGMISFVDDFLRNVSIRHKDLDLFIEVIEFLYKNANSSNFTKDIIQTVVDKILTPIEDYRISEKIMHFTFLRRLFVKKLIPLDQIHSTLLNFPKGYPIQYIILYYFFVSECYTKSGRDVEKMKEVIEEYRMKFEGNPKITKEMETFLKLQKMQDSMEKNSYAKLKEYIEYGCPLNSMEYALKFDKVDLLNEIVTRDKINLSERMEQNYFEPSLFVHWDPTPLEFAAFFGSYNCFKYIIKHNISLQYIPLFATAGCDIRILKVLASKKVSFEGCPRIAAYFRRYDIFEWIMTRHKENLNMKKELNYALSRAIAINYIDMIVQCIDIGANINFKDENQQTPLIVAATNDCLESVAYMIRYPSLGVAAEDAFGHKIQDLSHDPRIRRLIADAIEEENERLRR
ncbi:hypothetical protein TVAG_336340 [Trichomonas vaginalis G3]|uniref:Uncharacterized protein n=1 Tax=Trichomonas vaginalis (strain ATCC PRA-98 / G3) TaxID=412133 RepID=A2FIM9_TRIV3|nr:spectrin binding [Trichomonas vaginalis G3]EAX95239.1 hypothetical protein TVAG_336340 [Trichomonas vaginalis G3]KAI5503485.1 spectrin binding [Trichomonas vaginalis G3]|eukprot:XP_001308169.1 hypothetical protein [Trichomonas vaginalis G3]